MTNSDGTACLDPFSNSHFMNPEPLVDSFALSPMQQGMLFHYLKEPHSGVDIEQVVIHLSETLDVPRLKIAWQHLVERHGVLRARFVWEGLEHPHQQILTDITLPVTVKEAGHLPEDAQHKQLFDFLEDDRLQGFDLHQAPMHRVTLFQWDQASYSIVWTFHHAMVDGRSLPPLLKEVFDSYQELTLGFVKERPRPLSYHRYIDWLGQKDHSASAGFWRELLTGFTAPTPLVVDRLLSAQPNVPPHGESGGGLDEKTTTALKGLLETHRLSMNSFVMGAWAILLHRYSGEHDVVFGATRACRKSSVEGADDTIGLFINTVPVRARLTGSDTALAIAKQLRQQWLDVRPHEHTPLTLVKAVSSVPPAQPLFHSLVVFENQRLDDAMRSLDAGWAERQVELHELTNFPLTLAAYGGDTLSFKIEFDRRHFDDETVRRMLGHFRRLLESIAEDPQAAICDLTLLEEAERRALLQEFNQPPENSRSGTLPLDGEATLHGLFESRVIQQPHATALTYNSETLTYAELNARANQLAHELVRCGIGPDTLVGVCLERSPELVIAILAILKAGGAYLPIDLSYPADRLAFMLNDAQAPLLLTQKTLKAQLPSIQGRILSIDEVLTKPAKLNQEGNLSPRAAPDHLAYVIYTSGTTGKPKGSMISHRNAVRLFSATEHWYGFHEKDVWTLFHSTAFDFSVWELWGALFYGGRVVIVPFLVSRSPEAFYELLVQERVTVLNQTPSAFRQLIQAEESIGQRPLALRYVIFGGEALDLKSLRPWFERHGDRQPQLVNMYGITETTVHVTYRPISKDDLESGSVIGIPIPDLQVYILDQHKQPVPIGVPGEMYVGGAGLAKGYLRRPELTAERFIPDHLTGKPGGRLYRTGDLARFLPRRDIEYLGRIDHQVKIRGFRIELGEIESILCEHPAVREAVVIAREDVSGIKTLAAYVVAIPEAPDISALREHLKRTLPDYMVPATFVFLDTLPLTNNGKIDRKALPAPQPQRQEPSDTYVAPRTSVEEKLASIWGKVLRLERVGMHDNFFELGGDSILSIQVISLARREGLLLTPKLMFTYQTIAELALSIVTPPDTIPRQDVAEGTVPLTPIQQWLIEQNLDEFHHYNQAWLLEVASPMDRSVLECALAELSRQHDALRFRYVRTANGWRQSYAPIETTSPLKWLDLDGLDEAARVRAIESEAAAAQASLNVEHGPLWKVIYFDLGSAQSGRLLIVIHHMAVDGVSWRPLFEDLETAYGQLSVGHRVELPAKTASFKAWSEELHEFAKTDILLEELSYWNAVTKPFESAEIGVGISLGASGDANTEGTAHTVTESLTAEETDALLHLIPPVYNTHINDVLLTALTRAWNRWTGQPALYANLEGHGREPLLRELNLSRTVGWFTSIFPIRLTPAGTEQVWDPGQALKSIKEQLRAMPRQGIGYGLLRYIRHESSLATAPDPPLVFNYFGQFDHVLSGSTLFRFAAESTGPWHSPTQRRRHVLEINSMVKDSRLQISWTYCPHIHSKDSITRFTEEYLLALRAVIDHCRQPNVGGRTPSDFPLARLDQRMLDHFMVAWKDVEDIYRLSPIQSLFFSVDPGPTLSAFDQWRCTLRGPLNIALFQRAWQEMLRRHTILRTSIHGEGLSEPIQVVHRDVPLPWIVEDWRGVPVQDQHNRWAALLKKDRGQPLVLTHAPVMRFVLVRLAEDMWKFLWSVPAILLDGWSWPIVFREASRLYDGFSSGQPISLEPTRSYRDYIAWVEKQSASEALTFWKNDLKGFRVPTVLPSEVPEQFAEGERYPEHIIQLSTETTAELQTLARRLQLTLSTLVQAGWALLLARQSGTDDLGFGIAFAGRPVDLQGAEGIVGPFVNNVPLRVRVEAGRRMEDFLKGLHSRVLEVSPYQYTPLVDIQTCSEIPWQHRPFDSLVVFQNYVVDEAARRFGGHTDITDFRGPIHTNYPVLLLADPGPALRLALIYDRQRVARTAIERWGRDLASLLEVLPRSLDRHVSELQEGLSAPVMGNVRVRTRIHAELQNYVPPQTKMEESIAMVWQKMFGMERVSVEENLFDLGGHSLLLVHMHSRLRTALKRDFPLVTLFAHPTIRSLARYFEQGDGSNLQQGGQLRNRAQQQKATLAQLRKKFGNR